VTDVNLAGAMSGVELAQFAKRRFPGLNVVIVPGRGAPYFPHDPSLPYETYAPDYLLDAF
jgi:hypothetical protein